MGCGAEKNSCNENKVFFAGRETDDLIFSDDGFPSLADFPCLSSPSASSAASTQPNAPCRSTNSSASSPSSSSWSFLRVPTEKDDMQPPHVCDAQLVPNTDALDDDMPQESDGFDIIGAIDLWDTTDAAESSWPDQSSSSFFLEKGAGMVDLKPAKEYEDEFIGGGDHDQCPAEDLAKVFLDWLKSNKDSISPEDLRSIKLKRSTIECAARRLGGGKHGRVQLLKLILSWVQNHHLYKRRRSSRASDRTIFHDFSDAAIVAAPATATQFSHPTPPLNTNIPLQQEAPSNPNIHDLSYDAAPYSYWMPNYAAPEPPFQYYPDQPFVAEHVAAAWQQGFYSASSSVHYSPRLQHFPAAQYHSAFVTHFPGTQEVMYSPGLSVTRMASATKEARKTRMARKKRFSSLHYHRNQQNRQSLDTEIVPSEPPPLLQLPPPAALSSSPPMDLHRHALPAADRRRGGVLKVEKNLRFLLQKVLKQSDVGSLGRIVLPKKEAEVHLPKLDARDGISIEVVDIGTSRVWNMRYRFWPNNKSRMYLLENTGDFVRSNGLEEGDFIVIYSDVKCGKYMIRGVKVRQPVDVKGASNKISGKAHQKEKATPPNSKCITVSCLEGKDKSPLD